MSYTLTLHLSNPDLAETLTEAVCSGIKGFKCGGPYQTVHVQHGPGSYSPRSLVDDPRSQVSFHLTDYNHTEARRLALYVVANIPSRAFSKSTRGFYYDEDYCLAVVLNDKEQKPAQTSPVGGAEIWNLEPDGTPLKARGGGVMVGIARWARGGVDRKAERVFQDQGAVFRQSISAWATAIDQQPSRRNKPSP